MSTTARPFREILVQLLATVMIPLSVAGTGLYYTRWQQNLNDLKTMIDLVSDPTPEKRKYGVAMFEYLLKNDKVPVEFVAAQLAYANSSADKELFPLMEQALIKASAENAKVEVTYREALERMPSRLFVHTVDEKQRACVRGLVSKMKDTDRSSLVIPGYGRATWGKSEHEVRVFQATDLGRGEELAKLFINVGLAVKVNDLSADAAASAKSRPNTFELWLGRGAVPASCL
jgi:predicted transcriptional regulator